MARAGTMGFFLMMWLLGGSPAWPLQEGPARRTLPAPVTFKVRRSSSPVKIDGVLDDPLWSEAVNVPLAYEWAPGDNVPPPVKTDCLVTYDDRNLYIGFRAFDGTPAGIRAHFMDRDDTDTLIQDDHVGIMLDTFNDERRAFQFRVNALGVQADAIFSEQDGVEDFSWDMIWTSAGRIGPEGYVVEIALPLKQLRFQPGAAVQTWGFEAFRSWPRNVRHRLSSQPRDRNKVCLLCQENKITGLEGLAQGRNLEVDPTVTLSRTDERPDPSAELQRGKLDASGGVTARWSVTPNMTVNGTINPDFSQVEADVAQLDINTRFALFYPEKRPFFLEGLDFFTTPIQAVFTRTVADPTFGAKLTGKRGPEAFGLFVARDDINNLTLPTNQGSDSTSLDQGVTTTVGRYRRDIGKGSTLGGLFTSREGGGYFNRQFGADGFWMATESDSFHVQFIRTETRYPGAFGRDHGQPSGPFGGNGFWIDYQRVTRSWMGFAAFESYSPGFRSDTGFVPRVDERQVQGQVQRRWWRGAGGWFNTIDIGVRGWRVTDAHWTLTDLTAAGFINYTGPMQTQVQFNMPRDIIVYQGVRYQYFRPNFVFGIKPSGNVDFQVTGRFGGGVDYANGRAADRVVEIAPAVGYRPVERISIGLQHSLEQLSVAGGRLYRANLTQLKAIIHLNIRTFFRAILQYTDITRDPSLYSFRADARSKRLFSQYLFSYKLNPQTVLFAGYSDNSAAGGGIDFRRQDRTFFVKLGYAFVF
jgi:hypothetical protein